MGHSLEVPFGDGWYIVCPKCRSIGKTETQGNMVYFENLSYPDEGWFLVPIKEKDGDKSLVLISEDLDVKEDKSGLMEVTFEGITVGLGHINSGNRPCLYSISPSEIKCYCFKVEGGVITKLGDKVNIDLVKKELGRIFAESL